MLTYAFISIPIGNQYNGGKIEDNKVLFKGMGRGIIYLPCYYQNRSYTEANSPFLPELFIVKRKVLL